MGVPYELAAFMMILVLGWWRVALVTSLGALSIAFEDETGLPRKSSDRSTECGAEDPKLRKGRSRPLNRPSSQ